MKRIITIALALLMVVSVSAKKYEYSLGLSTGMALGICFKTMINPHFTIIDDLYYGMSFFGVQGGGGAMDEFIDCVNFAYQGEGTKGQNIALDWYVGGGTKLGAAGGFGMGKWGFNALVGFEINFINAPMAINFDFRPGFGLGFGGGGVMPMFDSSINAGIRYTF